MVSCYCGCEWGEWRGVLESETCKMSNCHGVTEITYNLIIRPSPHLTSLPTISNTSTLLTLLTDTHTRLAST